MENPSVRQSINLCLKKLNKKALFAYNVNLDRVCPVSETQIKAISKHLPELMDCFKNEEGAEIRVTKKKFDKIKRLTTGCSFRIGGQAGNMAMDSARLGTKAYLHTLDRSKKTMSHLSSANIFIASKNGFRSAKKSGTDLPPLIHLILEFKSHSSANRFILSDEKVNPSMKIDPVFSKQILHHIKDIQNAFLAGFHLVPYGILRKRVSIIGGQINEWRAKNPKIGIHLELGNFTNSSSERTTIKKILPECDSVGFNEDEFPSIMRILGKNEKTSALISLLEEVSTVLLHTSDYSCAFSKKHSSKKLYDSLTFASAVAAYKSMEGRAPTKAQLLKKTFRRKKVSSPFNGEALRRKGISCAVSPSMEITPKHTIGLGDCFSMAFCLSM